MTGFRKKDAFLSFERRKEKTGKWISQMRVRDGRSYAKNGAVGIFDELCHRTVGMRCYMCVYASLYIKALKVPSPLAAIH